MYNKKLDYKSIVAPYIKLLLEEKETHGYETYNLKYLYRELDNFICFRKLEDLHLKKELYEEWQTYVNDVNLNRRTIYWKMSAFRMLAVYLSQIGIECYIPHMPRMYKGNYIPYIFTHQQMADIFKACDMIRIREHNPKSNLISVPAFFRLLYSTGMRLGEAISIKNKDVNFTRHFIVLNKTKNNHQRLAPINPSLEAVLKQYLDYRNKLRVCNIQSLDHPFFVTSQGKPCSVETLERWFRLVLKSTGINYVGHHRGPRVHDIRHTACVHALIKMTAKGADIYCCMPILSRFMGHINVLSTEKYLRLTQEMHPEVIEKESEYAIAMNDLLSKSIINRH